MAKGPTVSNPRGIETAVAMVKRVQQVKATADLQRILQTDPVRIHLRVPLPLLPKAQAELQRAEEQGVMVNVMQPTHRGTRCVGIF